MPGYDNHRLSIGCYYMHKRQYILEKKRKDNESLLTSPYIGHTVGYIEGYPPAPYHIFLINNINQPDF